MNNAIHSWIANNPEYDHEFFDDARISDYIRNEFPVSGFSFGKEMLERAFRKIRPGAGKADLFRYLIMYDKGGVYMDVDTVCLKPLSSFVNPDDDSVTGLGVRGDFHQWGLIYVRRHPFMKMAVETIVANIINEVFVAGCTTWEGVGGPPCLDYAIKNVLQVPHASRFNPGVFDLSIQGRSFRCRVMSGDFFDYNVANKYIEYKSDLDDMGIAHWEAEPVFNK
jgi:mannosyltransferase OCH1-like enzyme